MSAKLAARRGRARERGIKEAIGLVMRGCDRMYRLGKLTNNRQMQDAVFTILNAVSLAEHADPTGASEANHAVAAILAARRPSLLELRANVRFNSIGGDA